MEIIYLDLKGRYAPVAKQCDIGPN